MSLFSNFSIFAATGPAEGVPWLFRYEEMPEVFQGDHYHPTPDGNWELIPYDRVHIVAPGMVDWWNYIPKQPIDQYEEIESITNKLFIRGSEIAKERGLILVDTKYEFGYTDDGKLILIDEIHTPDSSRYFYQDYYEENFNNNKPQKQLSKEFFRQWLIEKGFSGKEGQTLPDITNNTVLEVSNRYIELYEGISGNEFIKRKTNNIYNDIENNILNFLKDI